MKKLQSVETWKNVILQGHKQGSIRLSDLAIQMELDPSEALVLLRQLFPEGKGVEIYHKNNECWVDLKSESLQYMLPLSPMEWMHIYHILGINGKQDSSVSYSLQKKFTNNGPVHVVMELLSHLEKWDVEISQKHHAMIQDLEMAIQEENLVNVFTDEGKSYLVHPRKVIHLEDQLSLIAEDATDHCLLVVPIKCIKNQETIQKNSQVKVTPFEIEEFISAIRLMNEKETRLILKIHDPQSINLFPDYHFLGKPCMVTNPNGDLIWAAYVEPCDSLFDWIQTLGKNVEILDPLNFKREYLLYCEEKLRKIA